MFMWIRENIGTIIVCIILIVLVAMALIKIVRNRKYGNSSCGCEGCTRKDSCHVKRSP